MVKNICRKTTKVCLGFRMQKHGQVRVAQVLSSTTPYRDKSPGGEVSVMNLLARAFKFLSCFNGKLFRILMVGVN